MNHRILLVMPQVRRERLMQFLAQNDVEISSADGVKDAQRKLGSIDPCHLAFVDSDLPDGSWRDVLQFVVATRKPCEMVVCARCGDEHLWAEVIQCGAFDLISEPFERLEVLRIMNSALDSHYVERFGHHAIARVS